MRGPVFLDFSGVRLPVLVLCFVGLNATAAYNAPRAPLCGARAL